MPRIVPLLAVSMLLSACGLKSERTPEPSETQRVADLINRLGTDRSYNSRTLLWNPDPDGLVLSAWLARRTATLNGNLAWDQFPASINPGSIGATLTWEQQTEKAESFLVADYGEYSKALFFAGIACPKLRDSEQRWLDGVKANRTGGGYTSAVDWGARQATFKARCPVEERENSAEEAREKAAEAAEAANFVHAQEECRAIYTRANDIYMKAFTIETGNALNDASQAMRACFKRIPQCATSNCS
ncbi:hypothetical protein [Sphingomonas sp.]|uniref:hypothetical protein n=1 Tax=Sphingomonas sp. TaxID=28214 RepID=UPI003AFFCF0F